MLKIVVGEDAIDEATNKFTVVDGVELTLEHSLVSLSKWESKFEKPFLGAEEKTEEEILYYIETMITHDFPPGVLRNLSNKNVSQINDYINAKSSATWFNTQENTRRAPEVITSELIYYWMIAFDIPFDPCQHWHLNRLFTLIKVADIKNNKPKAEPFGTRAQRQRELNEARKRQIGTTG